MIIRALKQDDIKQVLKIHKKYYDEFDFPAFDKMLNAFIIEDGNQEIIMAGGIEQVAESVLVTNKEMSRIKIGRALVEAQQIVAYTCQQFGIREVYAFVNNNEYAEHLIQHGFSKHGLTALSMKVPNG